MSNKLNEEGTALIESLEELRTTKIFVLSGGDSLPV